MALISVIIPCYNVENYIDRCLESIFNQTLGYADLEIICINNASSDKTFEKLKLWEEKYEENILLVDCEENGYGSTARNIGIEYATGKYIAFVDADDWIEPDYLETMYEAIVNYDCDVVSCLYGRDPSKELQFFNKEERDCGNDVIYEIDTIRKRKEFFHAQPLRLYAWGKLIKKEFLLNNDISFPNRLVYEDIIWGNLLNMYVKKAYLVNRRLYHYFVNESSLVLKKNSTYHIDHLTIQELMWEEWMARGWYEEYKDELEYEYIYNGYISFLKIIAYRYDEPQYSLFRLLQKLAASKINRNTTNKYLNDVSVPELHKTLISTIWMDISKNDFKKMAQMLLKIGI